MSHMIELNRVSKYYTNRDTVSTGLSKVSLNLDMGEFVAITGESGSGKSTLLNVISGLDTYEEGEMFVGGQDTSAFKTVDYERYRKTFPGLQPGKQLHCVPEYRAVDAYVRHEAE